MRLLLLATLLGFGCTSAYRQNVLGTLKAKQAELRDHPDPRPAGLPRANQLEKVSNTSSWSRRCHTHEVLHLTPRWVFLDRFRGLAPAPRVS